MTHRFPRRTALALAGLAALPASIARARQGSPDENTAIVRRFYTEVLTHDGDLDAIDDLLAPGFTPQSAEDVPGPSAYKQRRVDQREALNALFQEWRWTIEELLTAGDAVAVRATIEGVNPGAETPRRTAASLGWFWLEDGRITRLWIASDDLF